MDADDIRYLRKLCHDILGGWHGDKTQLSSGRQGEGSVAIGCELAASTRIRSFFEEQSVQAVLSGAIQAAFDDIIISPTILFGIKQKSKGTEMLKGRQVHVFMCIDPDTNQLQSRLVAIDETDFPTPQKLQGFFRERREDINKFIDIELQKLLRCSPDEGELGV
jgi:hypothetical protein